MTTTNKPWTPLFIPPELSGAMLDCLLPALVCVNKNWLSKFPDTPALYDSGVRYLAEPEGEEKWLSIPFNLLAMAGDCEDLACWRAAELQMLGENANPIWSAHKTPGDGMLYHIQVRRADGRVEDPSYILGMGWEDRYTRIYGRLENMVSPLSNTAPTDMNQPWSDLPGSKLRQLLTHLRRVA